MKFLKHFQVLWSMGVLLLPLALCCSPVVEPSARTGSSSSRPHGDSATQTRDSQADETDIWKGERNDLSVRWTTKDLYVRDESGVQKVFSSLVKLDLERIKKDHGQPTNDLEKCEYTRNFEVRSVVGNLVSFEDEFAIACGRARPSSNLRFTTLDLSQAAKITDLNNEELPIGQFSVANPSCVVRLTDYFEAAEILEAFVVNPAIKNAIHSKPESPPRSLSDLSALLGRNPIIVGDEFFTLDPDFVTRFIFHHVTDDKVVVQVSLSPMAAAAQAARGILSLELPIPARLRMDLGNAQNLKQGFLGKDAPQISHGRTTTFETNF